eukprot:1320273-Pleurochrysis_carterae.AAC.3
MKWSEVGVYKVRRSAKDGATFGDKVKRRPDSEGESSGQFGDLTACPFSSLSSCERVLRVRAGVAPPVARRAARAA